MNLQVTSVSNSMLIGHVNQSINQSIPVKNGAFQASRVRIIYWYVHPLNYPRHPSCFPWLPFPQLSSFSAWPFAYFCTLYCACPSTDSAWNHQFEPLRPAVRASLVLCYCVRWQHHDPWSKTRICMNIARQSSPGHSLPEFPPHIESPPTFE